MMDFRIAVSQFSVDPLEIKPAARNLAKHSTFVGRPYLRYLLLALALFTMAVGDEVPAFVALERGKFLVLCGSAAPLLEALAVLH
jgi:hypothetical protein